jgi:hypothetical protein
LQSHEMAEKKRQQCDVNDICADAVEFPRSPNTYTATVFFGNNSFQSVLFENDLTDAIASSMLAFERSMVSDCCWVNNHFLVAHVLGFTI